MALFQDVAGAASQRLLSYKYNTPSISVSIVTSNHNHSLRFHDAYLVQVRGQPKHKHGGGAARISGDWQSGELHFPYLTSRFHQYLPSSVQIYSGVATWPPVLGSIRPCWTSASSHLQALADIQVEVLGVNSCHHFSKTDGLTITTQERLSCNWCIRSDERPRLGLHAQMWPDGPGRSSTWY